MPCLPAPRARKTRPTASRPATSRKRRCAGLLPHQPLRRLRERHAMLIKRSEARAGQAAPGRGLCRAVLGRARPPRLPQAGGPHRRGAVGARRHSADHHPPRRGRADEPPAARHAGEEHLHALLGRLHGDRRSVRTACGSARSRAGTSPINRGSHCAKGAAVRELVHGDRRLKYPMKLVNGQWTADLLGRGDQRDRRQADGDPREVGRRIRSTGWARRSSPTKAPISSASSPPSGAPTTSTTRRASAIRPPSPA